MINQMARLMQSIFGLKDSSGAVIDPATSTKQSDGTQKTQIVDSADSSEEVDVIRATDDDTDVDGKSGLLTQAILNARIDADTVKPLRMDGSTHSIQTLTYEHHEIHSGSHYSLCSYVDLSINNVYDIQITTPDNTKWSHFTMQIDSESETLWGIYENVTINTAGASENIINNNRNSVNTVLNNFLTCTIRKLQSTQSFNIYLNCH